MDTPAFDFKRDVVDLSFQKPVLIDFWAPWCGPCKMLTPVLEELQKESNDQWTLVKINTEEEQEIAAYFRIQSIPNCKLVYEGKIAGEFSGAQSKETVSKWLQDLFTQLEIPETVEAQSDDYDTLIANSDKFPDAKLIDQLKLFLSGNPDHQKALLSLVKHQAVLNPEEAINTIQKQKDNKELTDLLEDVQVLKEFTSLPLDEKTPAAGLLKKTRTALLEADLPTAIEQIIEAVHIEPAYREELPRRIGIAIFHLLGNQHPISKDFRKLFDMAIY